MESTAGVMSFGIEFGYLDLTRTSRPPCLERVMGIEPTSSAWKAEVLPLNYTREAFCRHPPTSPEPNPTTPALVEGVGFEPTKAEPPDLQSGPFGHSGTPPQRKRCIVFDCPNGVKQDEELLCLGRVDWCSGAATSPRWTADGGKALNSIADETTGVLQAVWSQSRGRRNRSTRLASALPGIGFQS